MNKYNYVFLSGGGEIFKISFLDAANLSNVFYLSKAYRPQNFIGKILYRIHFSKQVNKIFKLPFKNLWNSCRIRFSFAQKRKLCFILFTDWVSIIDDIKLISYLRKHYPDCKIVWFAQDIIDSYKSRYSGKPFDIKKLKKDLDLIVSYDMKDAEKYGLLYHNTVLSKIDLADDSSIPQNDLYFLGKPKSRLNQLVDLAIKFKNYGLKCGIYLLGVAPEDQIKVDGITYLSEPLTYKENLKYMKKSRCVLELMQPGAVGYTFRTSEALLYGKKLITNNSAIVNAPFYDKDNIFVLGSDFDMRIKEITKKIKEETKAEYQNTDILSPIHFLNFLDEQLG